MFKPNSNRGPQATPPSSANLSLPLRLPQLWNAPAFEEISNLLAAAKKEIGRMVELPFSLPDGDNLFQIKVIQPQNGDPEWTFSSGSLSGLTQIWSIPCIDLQLIHSLVESESTGKDSVDLIAANSFNRSSTGNIAFPSAAVEEQATTQNLNGAAHLMQNLNSPGDGRSDTPVVRAEAQQIASLEGDLEKLNLPAVLQSLSLSKMTGRLGIASKSGGGDLFIVEGSPVHATTGDTKGDYAVVEMLLWPSGKFKFFEQEKCTDCTLTKRLENLLMEGLSLLDQYNYLKAAGLNMDTFLLQAYRNLSEMQFEQMVTRGAPVSMSLQKDFYMEVDGTSSLYELLLRMPLAKAEWVPVVYNLVSVGLVRLSNDSQTAKAVEQLVDKDLDEQGIAAAVRTLNRPETDVFAYPVFQYFVKNELARHATDAKAFTIIVFDLLIDKGTEGRQAMPLQAAKIALDRIKGLKRPIDVLGHFETFDYALLLPQTAARSASIVAQRILERVNATAIPGLENCTINIAFGIAACPQHSKSAGTLLAAAADAKKQARKTSIAIVEYKAMS